MNRAAVIRQIGRELTELTVEKNAAYGSSFTTSGEALKLLFPDGIPPEKYGDALLVARLWDKMGRIAHAPDAFDEDPYRDIAGYGLVAAAGKAMERQWDNDIDAHGPDTPSRVGLDDEDQGGSS